jgi:phospholipid/cholesterol/gamma-HCH transport system substrate-binding protein
METRANYALIGLFTLAIIAAAFGFVMWFSGAEKPGGRNTYKIVFTGSVSGLSVGGWVLFNGVRVGEVSKIDLMPQDPPANCASSLRVLH